MDEGIFTVHRISKNQTHLKVIIWIYGNSTKHTVTQVYLFLTDVSHPGPRIKLNVARTALSSEGIDDGVKPQSQSSLLRNSYPSASTHSGY